MSHNNNNDSILKQGWIMKKSKHLEIYRNRFMQLKHDKLFFYKTDQFRQSQEQPTEIFDLAVDKYRLATHDTVQEKFYLINETNDISRTFKAESQSQRNNWMVQITNCIQEVHKSASIPLSIDPNRYMASLVNDEKLLRSKSKNNKPFIDIFEKHGALICCYVTPKSRAIPYHNFESTYYIHFQYKNIELKNRHDSTFCSSDYKTETRLSYYLLHLTYNQFVQIEKLTKRNGKLFAEPCPKPLAETIKRRGDLHAQYVYEESLITKPILPLGPNKSILGKKRSMTANDVQKYANYLHKVLNSELLLLDELYEILGICDPEIIRLFKVLASTKLETLKSVANEYDECIRNPNKLKTKSDIKFHTLWIVKRALNHKGAALFGDHWALKFEGNDHLMTIGFFSYNEKHGIILTKIVPNTPLNRRLFWHYWSRANAEKIESKHFNSTWTVLEKLYLDRISCALIGTLIKEWLSYDNHAIYNLTYNNCQHFVRDIVAPLNISAAHRLSAAFDVKVVKSLIPGGLFTEGIGAQAKCNKTHQRLWPILSQYQQNMKLKKQQKNATNAQQEFENNFDFIANQLGISFSSNYSNLCLNEQKENQQIVDIVDIDQETKESNIIPLTVIEVTSSPCFNNDMIIHMNDIDDDIKTNSNALLSNHLQILKNSTVDFDSIQFSNHPSICASLSDENVDHVDINDQNDQNEQNCVDLEEKYNENTQQTNQTLQNTFEDTIKQCLSDNVIGDAIILTEQLLNIANLWQDSPHVFGDTQKQNISTAYPLGNQQKNIEISTHQSDSLNSGESKKNGNDDEESNNSDNFNNNNNGNPTNKKNNNQKNNNTCGIPWHAIRLKELQEENNRLKSAEMDAKYDIHNTHNKSTDDCFDYVKNDITINSAIIIKPSKKLTKNSSQWIQETFSNMFAYMSQYSVIHQDAVVECKCDQGVVQVIDYNIHAKQTKERLYAVCQKTIESENKNIIWKTNDCLYTQSDITQKFKISCHNLPNTSMNSNAISPSKIECAAKEIENILRNDKQRNKLVNIHNKKIAWNNRDKIPIFNKTSKTINVISLELTKEEFVTRLRTFANENANNIHLVPIIKFNANKYYFEIAWIVNIGMNMHVNIAITLKIIKNKKAGPTIVPTQIYLDINDQHKLVPYEHNCKCLDTFKCDIDILAIGPNKQNRVQHSKMQQTLNEYKQKCDIYADKLSKYEQVRQQDTMIINQTKEKYAQLQNNLKQIQQFLGSLLQQQNQVNQLNQQIISGRLQQYQSQIQTDNNHLSTHVNNLHPRNQ